MFLVGVDRNGDIALSLRSVLKTRIVLVLYWSDVERMYLLIRSLGFTTKPARVYMANGRPQTAGGVLGELPSPPKRAAPIVYAQVPTIC